MAGKVSEQAIHEAITRSYVYRFLSAAFLYPDDAFPSGMVKDRISELQPILPSLIDGETAQVASQAMASHDCSLDTLQTQFRQIFGHTISQECPPYETEYGTAHIFQQAQRLGDIAGFYRAFGLEISHKAKERLDHIAVELEFMSFLALKEAYALMHDGEEKTAICREAQQKFLEEHLGRWAPLFAKLLDRKSPNSFYRHVGSVLDAFITAECRRLEVRPSVFTDGEVKRESDQFDRACFSCGMDDRCGLQSGEVQ